MLGLNDLAGMMIAFSQAINRFTEHTARVISYRTMYVQNYEADIELPKIDDDWDEVEELLRNADVFHFHMLLDETYQVGPFHLSDFVAGKALLYHHHGTYDHQCFLGQAAEYRKKYAEAKKRVLVSTPDLLLHLPMATWQPNIIPIGDPLLLPDHAHFVTDGPFRVVQAPTRKWHKNTAEFLAVCEQLASERDDFVFEVITGKSFEECLKSKRRAHASFDHMQGWFGIASLESLSQGVPTLAGLTEQVIGEVLDFTGATSHPWRIVRDSSELKNELTFLADERAEALAIGREARSFMERHWTEQQVLAPLLGVYSSLV